MGLPSYSAVSGTQFRVGFGPRGTQQRLILTKVRLDRITNSKTGSSGLVIIDPDPSAERQKLISDTGDGRISTIFKIPWQVRSEEDVQNATHEALRYAHGHFVNRVAFMPLGMDDDGILSPDQSARAMLGAIYSLWAGEENKIPHQILISIHADSMAYQDFELALERHFFPYRQAENPNSGLDWKRASERWVARHLKTTGQSLFECLDALNGDAGRDAAQIIYQIAKERPTIFKAKDVDRMSPYDGYEGIPETLLILRNLGGRLGEAARRCLVNREKAVAMDVVREEVKLIAEADSAEMVQAVLVEREGFLASLVLERSPVGVDDMYSGDGPQDIRCRYERLWGKIAMFSWTDDSGRTQPQFVSFHRAEPVPRSTIQNNLFTMGIRVANREEAENILKLIKVSVLARYGSKANMGSHRLDGSQEWFLNLCAAYRDRPTDLDSDWHVASLPEDIGRGTLYLHFQNHAESDWDSHRVLRILAEDFGLTLVSQRNV